MKTLIKKLKNFRQNGIVNTVIQLGVKAPPEELQRVEAMIEQEILWMANFKPYLNNKDINLAVKKEELLFISENTNTRPIMRYRNPRLASEYPPYLRSRPAYLLEQIGQDWRRKMRKSGLSDDIKLAVTMLTCTREYQQKLIKGGKLAVDKGPHSCGFAFDIDGCGYYLGDTPINPRPEKQPVYEKILGAEVNDAVPFGSYEMYDKRVHTILEAVLDAYMQRNLIHYIVEYPDTDNSSYHICANPF